MKSHKLCRRIMIGAILLFFYFPILYMLVFSFNGSRSLTSFDGFSLQWYDKMLHDPNMLEAIYYTLITAVAATVISTAVGTVTAIGLSKLRRMVREVVSQINNLPIMNPEIVTAVGLMLFYVSLRIEKGFVTMLLAHIAFCIPYVILSVMPKLRSLDDNLAEAAMDLGATPWQAMRKVIVPQLMPGIISGALIAFTMSFDDFTISYFVTGNGVKNISTLVWTMSKRINPSINALSAIIVLMITVTLLLVNLLPIIKEKTKTKTSFVWKHAASVVALCFVLFIGGGLYWLKSGTQTHMSSEEAVARYGSNILKVYNVGEYIDPQINTEFEKRYGVKIIYDTFDSNELMYTKLQGGERYDILVPSDYMIERLLKEDFLQPLHHEQIPNLTDLAEPLYSLSYDPDHTYSVPYFWGTVGIVYNKNNVDIEDLEKEGYNIFRNQKYKGRIYMYDSERDSFMMALKALGYSMNTDDEHELQQAYEWLKEVVRTMNPEIVTDEVIDAMANGNKDMALVYSGDATYILAENEEMGYFMPKEGTNLWSDAMVIPKNAPNPKLANEYINFILEYENSMRNSEFVGYASTNGEVLEQCSGDDGIYADNEAYLPRSGYDKDEIFHYNDKARKLISELWTKVKIAK